MRKLINWFFGLRLSVRWIVGIVTTIALLLIAVTVSATTWEYTNSPEFCGTTCHTMPPEYAAYQVSPHARVDCVDCHLGRDTILMTVPRKAREFNHVINALTQAYEPPIYVKSLRPARDTCERCHNPDKFSSDTFVEIKRFSQDEENTQDRIFLILKTGGGTQREGLGRGIHWHIENEVWYYTDDPLKQTIPYVREVKPDGEVIEYFDTEAGLPATFGQEVEGQLERMDCIDCHNRISHHFRSPDDAIDLALSRQQINRDIPFIKEKGVEVLTEEYPDTATGTQAIASLEDWYQESYPDYYAQNKDAVQNAINVIDEIFTSTVFPNMKVGWETHPNNLGHKEFPGCFRCHDGKHTSVDNQTVRLECNVCHSIPEVVEAGMTAPVISIDKPDEPDSHRDSNWLARHRYEFDASCADCHDISNPGGTDNSSFCSNSGCHATEWKFVGLDAPAIRALVEPPQVPDSSDQPEEIPHPVEARTDCENCHGADSVIAYPADHAAYDQSLCTLCHEASVVPSGEVMAEIEVPGIPHLVKGQEDKCLDCHDQGEMVPFPENHAEWNPENCLFCHDLAEEKPEASGEDKPKRPLIPHTLEGREDCLACHSLDSIAPFPADHEEHELDDCTVCHKQEES